MSDLGLFVFFSNDDYVRLSLYFRLLLFLLSIVTSSVFSFGFSKYGDTCLS